MPNLLRRGEGQGGTHDADINELSAAARVAVAQSGQNADGCVQARSDVGDRRSDRGGGALLCYRLIEKTRTSQVV